jgi:hypothetical protein
MCEVKTTFWILVDALQQINDLRTLSKVVKKDNSEICLKIKVKKCLLDQSDL